MVKKWKKSKNTKNPKKRLKNGVFNYVLRHVQAIVFLSIFATQSISDTLALKFLKIMFAMSSDWYEKDQKLHQKGQKFFKTGFYYFANS